MSASVVLRSSLLSIIALLAACQTAPPEPPEVPQIPVYVDPTPPSVRLQTEGLRHNVVLDQTAKRGMLRRVRSSDQVRFVATGADRETGVRQLGLQGEVRVNCLPVQNPKYLKASADKMLARMEPIHEELVPQVERVDAVELLPRRLRHEFVIVVGAERGKCPPNRFLDMTLTLTAESVNGQGQKSRSKPAVLRFFGPDQIKVGSFNAQGGFEYSDTEYLRWGATLGRQVDVLLLGGMPDPRRVELIATMAGMPHVALLRDDKTDLAIASRVPLDSIKRQVIAPPGELESRQSKILSANAIMDNYPLQFVAVHLGLHDANDHYMGPEVSSPARQMAAQMMLDMLAKTPEPAFVGGTLNAYSGRGPQFQPGSKTAEIDLLLGRLLDPFILLASPDSAHCSTHRIDYLMTNGSYVPTGYEACFPEAVPSNHPFILVTFEVP